MIALMRILNTKTNKGRDGEKKIKTVIHRGAMGSRGFRKSIRCRRHGMSQYLYVSVRNGIDTHMSYHPD